MNSPHHPPKPHPQGQAFAVKRSGAMLRHKKYSAGGMAAIFLEKRKQRGVVGGVGYGSTADVKGSTTVSLLCFSESLRRMFPPPKQDIHGAAIDRTGVQRSGAPPATCTCPAPLGAGFRVECGWPQPRVGIDVGSAQQGLNIRGIMKNTNACKCIRNKKYNIY